LKSRKLIEQVFTTGKSFVIHPFKISYTYTSTEIVLQAGFGTSVKNFARAVDRNRIKRVTRETYRLQKDPLYESLRKSSKNLAVFFIYIGKELPVYEDVFKKMGNIIERLIQINNESSPANT